MGHSELDPAIHDRRPWARKVPGEMPTSWKSGSRVIPRERVMVMALSDRVAKDAIELDVMNVGIRQ